LDEHRKVATMFKQEAEYSVQMKNILLKPFNLEINNKQIIEEKDRLFKSSRSFREGVEAQSKIVR
jgi:hypothetical protein